MFAKFSIRAKITAVVAFLLLVTAGMGLLAVRNMQAMKSPKYRRHHNQLAAERSRAG